MNLAPDPAAAESVGANKGSSMMSQKQHDESRTSRKEQTSPI